jgi:hypothetical protein
MNIDELTYGQLKEIAEIIKEPTKKLESPLMGKYVLVRCHSAGVHCGVLASKKGDEVILKNSRRLWSWGSNGGIALSGVAQFGLIPGKKVDSVNPLIELNGVIETIPCSKIAEDSINGYQ